MNYYFLMCTYIGVSMKHMHYNNFNILNKLLFSAVDLKRHNYFIAV